MALTDNERQKHLPRNKKKFKKDVGNTRYSDKQKIEAVHSYLALGNLALTSRILGIPEITLRKWKAEEWWKVVVEDLKMQERIELSARMKKLIEASQTLVAQRLESGDPIVTSKGQIAYKPVSMKDAHKVAIDLIDRRKEVEKMTQDNTITEKDDDRKLEKLAERFAEMATKSIENNLNKKRTIDVDFADVVENDNAVHEERKTRLQDGICQIPLEAGTNQESYSEDDSTSSS